MSRSGNSPFVAIVTVFFFWGFLAASNGIFIPFCKTHFKLSQFESQLIDSAFYGAYFIGSLMLYIFSLQLNSDIINRIGYKKTIVYGLGISILGALTMIPAVNSGSFPFILVAFFIIALGFSLQQTSANPLVLNIGDPARGASRLNFAGSINSFGTTVGPILVSFVLFGKAIATGADKESASISSINILYIILGVAFALAAIILHFTKVPKLTIEESDNNMKILKGPLFFIIGTLLFLVVIFLYFSLTDVDGGGFLFLLLFALFLSVIVIILLLQYQQIKKSDRLETKSYPQVVLGMVAIFIYVGVEVSVQSNLGSLLKLPDFGNMKDSEISPLISLYWGSLMIGRWTGSIGAFNLSKLLRVLLTIVVPFIAFAVVLYMNYLNGANASNYFTYAVCVAILVAAFFLGQQKPALTLIIFGILGTAAMIVGLLTKGQISVYAFLSGGLFCSIMWPCIFSLATAGLGKYTSQASGFLIMMILGGAFIPPLQGLIADKTNIHSSYIICVFCFAFLAWYAFRVRTILKRNGIDYDNQTSSSH
ncbi:MAG: glucose transporter [Bacteroidetes bacterium]|jgi:FHS family L-fucose permease-like MFS transporter|nr:glucose transporter [Bacteroidota bacterium]